MRPLLKDGSIINVCPAERYAPGDVVAYRYENKNYVHRIKRIENNRIFILDDVNITDGHWIRKSDIMGKVPGILRAGKSGLVWNIFARNFYSLFRK